MPTYRYTARNTAGKAVRGAADAPDERQLVTRLRAEGLFLMYCREAERDHGRTRLGALQLSEFCRQIGMMLSSGVTLLRAVGILLQRDQKKRIKRVYQGLYDALQRGRSLSEAMRGQHGAFPELLIGMVYAGESSGTLDSVTLKMATFYEKEHRLHNRIISAVIYPVILLCITVLVVIGIFTFVLPNFFDMFQDMVLPVPTQVVMAISTGLTQHWGAVLIGMLAFIGVLAIALTMPAVRYGIDRTKLHMPVIGKLMRTIYTARFSRTLSSLYSSGLPMIDAIAMSRDTVGNRYLAAQFDIVLRQVREGMSLSYAIAPLDGFDPKLAATIQVGEETGRLDAMLESTADSFDYEGEMATQKLTTFIEPILIVFMAIVVGAIMISVMLPIFDIYNTIG